MQDRAETRRSISISGCLRSEQVPHLLRREQHGEIGLFLLLLGCRVIYIKECVERAYYSGRAGQARLRLFRFVLAVGQASWSGSVLRVEAELELLRLTIETRTICYSRFKTSSSNAEVLLAKAENSRPCPPKSQITLTIPAQSPILVFTLG